MSASIQSNVMPVQPAVGAAAPRTVALVPQPATQPNTSLPAAPAPAKPAPVEVVDPREKASRVAAELERIAPPNSSLRFRVDPEAGRVVVSVVDAETGDVLRQIPSEEALAIAQSLADTGSGIVKTQA